MSWFDRRAKRARDLIGRWAVDPTDVSAEAALGEVILEFDDRGNLIYIIKDDEKDQVILMTYQIDGRRIITDQPSHPSPQATDFELAGDRLMLAFEGVPSKFVRTT